MSVRLSTDEAWAVLAGAHTGILTTLKTDGTPVALPVWFVALDERVYVVTPEPTKKVGRVKRDPRVSFLVESGERWAELVGVHITGQARLVDDPEVRSRVRSAMDEKYASYRTAPTAMPKATRDHYAVVMAVLEITPDDRILSWDNSRLHLGD